MAFNKAVITSVENDLFSNFFLKNALDMRWEIIISYPTFATGNNGFIKNAPQI